MKTILFKIQQSLFYSYLWFKGEREESVLGAIKLIDMSYHIGEKKKKELKSIITNNVIISDYMLITFFALIVFFSIKLIKYLIW